MRKKDFKGLMGSLKQVKEKKFSRVIRRTKRVVKALTAREKALFYIATHFNSGVQYDELHKTHKESIHRVLTAITIPARAKGRKKC